MTIAAALAAAAQRLAATSDTARLDAEVLMAHALGVSRSTLILQHLRDPLPDGVPDAFEALIARRCDHEPVAYIIGHQPFWGLDLAVSPAVLIPRGDSETLIAAAVERLRKRPPARVIDLGTGSGALLLAALSVWPQAHGVGIDRSTAALEVARGNGERLGLTARAQLLVADWTCAEWQAGIGRFDLVLANPPYVSTHAALDRSVVAHEPHGALFAGDDGLDDYRVLVPVLPDLLAPGGVALIEIGATQAAAVAALAHEAGLAARVHPDLAGRPRAVELKQIAEN